MRVVALEEHLTIPALSAEQEAQGIAKPGARSGASRAALLDDVRNLCGSPSMDETGVTLQVLSGSERQRVSIFARSRAEILRGATTTVWPISSAKHPTSFAAFAHLPMTNPAASADELERAVKECGLLGALVSGQCDGENFSTARSTNRVARALYRETRRSALHPPRRVPPEAVQRRTIAVSVRKSRRCSPRPAGGWRAGDRHPTCCGWCSPDRSISSPRLKVIVGHMGEMLPTMLAHCDDFRPPERHRSVPRSSQPDDPRPRVHQDQRLLHRAAVSRRAAHVRRRPSHPVFRSTTRSATTASP